MNVYQLIQTANGMYSALEVIREEIIIRLVDFTGSHGGNVRLCITQHQFIDEHPYP